MVLLYTIAEVQSLDKPDHINNCNELDDHFVSRILQKYKNWDEIHLVFYYYDVTSFLKTTTRGRRQKC